VHPGARLDAPRLDWLWRELERRDLVLVLDLGAAGSQSYQTSAVNTIARCHPDLKIVIPHLAQPNPQVEEDSTLWQRWLEQVDLARRPNVWLDTAALPSYLPQEDYPYPSVTRYVRMAVERVGVDKILWGTDQPGPLPHVSYPQLVKLARLHMAFLSSYEQAKVLGVNATTVYNA
jgi:predicted TIM-barrel fold metal-dependent hydrolase